MQSFIFTGVLSVNGSQVTSTSESASGGALLQIEDTVADAATNFEIACVIDEDNLQGLFLMSTQDVTVETNDGTTPQETIALAANVPVVWTTDSAGAKPISDDVTALYITNASGAAATLTVIALTNPSP